MSLEFVDFSITYTSELTEMSCALYDEDTGGEPMNQLKIQQTIDFLTSNPSNGRIIVFLSDQTIVGYSIVIHFWSNEFGGLLLHVDELFVKESFRSKKIGSYFFDYLKSTKEPTHKGVFLEVNTTNLKAVDFYLRNGFRKHPNQTMVSIY